MTHEPPAHWFKATDSDGNDVSQELRGFAETIGLERIAAGRYSIVLLLELFGGFRSGSLNPAKVIREIEALEGLGQESSMKPASLFERNPLKGLWHKHFLQDGLPSMAVNLKRGLDKFGIPSFEKAIEEAISSGEERYVTQDDIAQIARDISHGNWVRLAEESSLTGEWIIFAVHEGKNYYLTLGEHKSGDDSLRSKIDSVCTKEFPFLIDLLPKMRPNT